MRSHLSPYHPVLISVAVATLMAIASTRTNGQETPALLVPDAIDLGSKFGDLVAIHDDQIAASSGDSVIVFRFVDGEWQQRFIITAPQKGAAPRSLVLTATYLAVAWRGVSDADKINVNEVAIYRSIEHRWKHETSFRADQHGATDRFGVSLAGDVNRLAVGDPGDQQLAGDAGAVHLFVMSSEGWKHETKLVPPEPAAFAQIGQFVGLNGDRCVTTGNRPDAQGGVHPPQGALVYRRVDNAWNIETRLTPAQVDGPGIFGSGPIAVTKDMIVLGNQRAHGTTGAIVFVLANNTWHEDIFLGCRDQDASTFGTRLVATESTVAIGAPLYIYKRGSPWKLILVADEMDRLPSEYSLGISERFVAVGLPRGRMNDLPSGRIDIWSAPYDDIPPTLQPNHVAAMTPAEVERRLMWTTNAIDRYAPFDEALAERLSRDFDMLMKRQLERVPTTPSH